MNEPVIHPLQASDHSGQAPSVAAFLRVLQGDMARVLAPELQSTRAKALVGIMDQLIELLVAREERLPAAMAARDDALYAVLADATTVPPVVDGDAAAVLADMLSDAGAPRGMVASVIAIEEAFDRTLATNEAAGSEMAFRISGGEALTVEGPQDVAVTEQHLTAILRHHLPDYPEVRCTGLQLIPGGNSKDTILFTTEGAPGLEQLVMRKDLLASSFGDTVVDEYPILVSLYNSGFPVARPIFCETSDSPLGAPFLVSARVPGVTAVSLASGGKAALAPVGRAFAAMLAQLHALDATKIPVRHSDCPPDRVARTIVDGLEALWKRKRLVPNPLMEFAFAWLRDNVPPPPPRTSLIHADAGFHNILTEGGEVTALLDWEFAHVGDACEDLAYVQPFVEPYLPFDQFLAAYGDAGGQPWDEDRLRYFGAIGKLRIAVGCHSLQHSVEHRVPFVDSKSANTGILYGRRFLIDAVKQMIE